LSETEERLRQLEAEIERRLLERFAALRDEFDRLRLEADRRWAGFLTRFDQDFTGIVPPELLAPPQAAPPPPEAAASAAPGQVGIDDVRTLDAGENQVEVLRRFLDLCGAHSSRAVLFVSRGGSLEAWKAVGFSDRGGDDEAVRKVSVAAGDETLRRALDGAAVRLGRDNVLSRALDARDVSDAVLVPMVVREKISGLVYADCAGGEEEGFHPETISLLTYLAGTVVDRLASRRLRPSPSLKAVEAVEPQPAAAPERAPEPPPAPAPAPPPPVREEPRAAEPSREFELAEEAESAEPEAPPPSFASAPPEEPAAPPPAPAPPPSVTTASWQADVEPPPMPRSVEPPLSMEAPAEGPLSRPSTSTRRLAGPLAPPEGDERREEARRFARLLISEIKLYNERAVLEGRERSDLYSRLREDIDRSRQMYDERIPADVRSNSNFFYEEMVRILADGRPEALGL
jgi:hypothetical protein